MQPRPGREDLPRADRERKRTAAAPTVGESNVEEDKRVFERSLELLQDA